MTTVGELKIVPSAALGKAGPEQGEPVYFNWKWSYSASGLAIWVALILAMAAPKANRHPRMLLILIPLVIVNLIWLALKKGSGMPSSAAFQYDTVFHSITVGLTVLWLLMHNFSRLGGFVRFVMSYGLLLAVSCLGILSYSTEASQEAIILLAVFAILSMMVLGPITVAGRLCRGMYRPLRFMLRLAVWTVVGALLTMYAYVIVMTLLSAKPVPDIMTMVMLSFAGLILGLCLYALQVPFMILGFKSSFFRERFKTYLRLETIPTTPEEEAACD
jgi:hypothetical protein